MLFVKNIYLLRQIQRIFCFIEIALLSSFPQNSCHYPSFTFEAIKLS